MKKYIFFIVALFFICCTKNPTWSYDYPIQLFIRVTGSDVGLLFSGTYGNSSMSIDVEGVVPQKEYNWQIGWVDYPINLEDSNDEVFANFKKEQTEGTLILKIMQPSSNPDYPYTRKEASTSASYGSVYISWKQD